MKISILFYLIYHVLPIYSYGQDERLKLLLVSEYRPGDSSLGYKIRIDFISQKNTPVKFIYNPLISVHCCPDIKDQIGVEIEQFDSSQYRPIQNCSDCHPVCCDFPKLISKTLNRNDTISYHDELTGFSRIGTRKDDKVISMSFVGRYRCKAWRIYQDKDGEHKIYSNWLYIEFPKK